MEEGGEEVEEETIESLKMKIKLLQDFILETSDDEPISHKHTHTSSSHTKDLEKKVKYLTDQMLEQRQRHHNAELKARVTLQQKVLEAKAASEKEITEYKAQIVVLQSRVHCLQEEINDVRPLSDSFFPATTVTSVLHDRSKSKLLELQLIRV
jgi:hypothetical protein